VANQGEAEDGAGQRFTVRPVQSPLLSAMGAGSVLLMMFALAYLESIMRSVRRRGRSRPGAWPLTAMPVGAAFGTAAALLGAVLHRAEPRPSGLAVAAALGAVAAALATLARARFRRQVGASPLTS
jgi:serine/threonine-protein kinase